jgi:hypothetical protein
MEWLEWPCACLASVKPWVQTPLPLSKKKKKKAGQWWLTPKIPATQEAETRRIAVWSQPRQIVRETVSQKNPSYCYCLYSLYNKIRNKGKIVSAGYWGWGEGGGGVGGKGGGGGRGEKWTKPCMHIWIIRERKKKTYTCMKYQGETPLNS